MFKGKSATTRAAAQPLKWHGGKSYLAKAIIDRMPPRASNSNAPAADDPGWVHYVEPYFGGGAVLLAQNPEGISEVVNDVNGELTNFWDVLKSPTDFADLHRTMSLTPCSKIEFERACSISENASPVTRAVAFLIRNRQSRQALGKDFCTLARNRTRRGMNELPSAWLGAIEGLPEIHARLQRVVILNDDALKVIRQQDGSRTLFYLDPPYLHETRAVTDAYQHEMGFDDHVKLLNTLSRIEGRFLLSGYRSELYDTNAVVHGWNRTDFEIDNKAGSGKSKRKMVECVWTNYTR
jgi:DNA adenine methylase